MILYHFAMLLHNSVTVPMTGKESEELSTSGGEAIQRDNDIIGRSGLAFIALELMHYRGP